MVYNGKPYEQMDDLGGFPPIFGNTHMFSYDFSDFHGLSLYKLLTFTSRTILKSSQLEFPTHMGFLQVKRE